MALRVQIVILILAALCLFTNGKPCEAEVHGESCGCTVEVTTPKPNLRIEIRDSDDPDRPKFPSPSYPARYPPSYPPSYPSSYSSSYSSSYHPSYPSVPSHPAEYPTRTGLSRYVPIYHDMEPPRNYRPLDLIDAGMEKDYYVVPIGTRRKVIKVPTI